MRTSASVFLLGVVFSWFLRKLWSLAPLRDLWRAEGDFHFFGHPWRPFDFPFWFPMVFFAFFVGLRGLRLLGCPISPRRLLANDAASLFFFPVALLLIFWRPDFPTKIWMGGLYAAFVLFRTAGAYLLIREAVRSSLPARSLKAAVFALFFLPCLVLSPWHYAVRFAEGDEPGYLLWTASLARDGDLNIENNIRDGDYEDFMALDSKPIEKARADLGSGHPRIYSFSIVPGFWLKGWLGVLWEQGLLLSLAGLFVFLFLLELSLSAGVALFTTACLCFAYPAIALAFHAYPETLALALTSGALLLAVREFSWGRTVAGVVVSGLLVVLKARYAMAGGLFYVFFTGRAFRKAGKKLPAFALLAPIAGLIPVLWRNLRPYTGDAGLGYGLKRVLTSLWAPYSEKAASLLGSLEMAWVPHRFYQEFWRFWLDQGGLLALAPIYLLAFAGIRDFARARRSDFWLTLAVLSLPTAVLVARGTNTGWSPVLRFSVHLLPLAAPFLAFGLRSLLENGRTFLPAFLGTWSLAVSFVFTVFPEMVMPNYWPWGGTDIGWANQLVGILDPIGFPLHLYKLWPGFYFMSELNVVFPAFFIVLAAWLALRRLRPGTPRLVASGRSLDGDAVLAPSCVSSGPLGHTVPVLWGVAALLAYAGIGNYLTGGEEVRWNLDAYFRGNQGAFEEQWFTHRFHPSRRIWVVRGDMLNGPYLKLGPGQYSVRYGLQVRALSGCDITLRVASWGDRTHNERALCPDTTPVDDPTKNVRDFYVDFVLEQEVRDVEFRVYSRPGAEFRVYRIELVEVNSRPSLIHYAVGRIDEALGMHFVALRRYMIAYEMGKRGPWIQQRIQRLLGEPSLNKDWPAGLSIELDPDPALFHFLKIDRVARTLSAG